MFVPFPAKSDLLWRLSQVDSGRLSLHVLTHLIRREKFQKPNYYSFVAGNRRHAQ